MSEKSLSEIITGIKDCLMSTFAPHMSLIDASEDGWTMIQYVEALAQHFVPAIERLLTADPQHAEHRAAIEGLRAEIVALNDKIGMTTTPPEEVSATRPWLREVLFGKRPT